MCVCLCVYVSLSLCDSVFITLFTDIEMLNINKRLTLPKLYAPRSRDHPEFFDQVINEFVSMDNELIVIGGDWNVALNPKIDSNQPSSVYRAISMKNN